MTMTASIRPAEWEAGDVCFSALGVNDGVLQAGHIRGPAEADWARAKGWLDVAWDDGTVTPCDPADLRR